MRMHLIAVIAMFLATNAGAAAAQTRDAAVQRANRMAYEAAMKCFVTAGAASGEREDAGDRAAAARYEQAARRSFDTASRLGEVLGYSGSRINQDFGLAQTRELPKLVADATYNRNAAATCRAIGLM
ncbi:MAG: hypothetical protein EPN98_14015 [Phenylobacterium sp.]|uniref:hypothetical protein n=1 Tax=Phenylobacterium sp. TaxID=1871053 RepID=UPI001203E941|nr:hypothetical protein [Phenylobacterium sp.]TAL32262.1 MAG: hypothetical protein EPN98_14015 [Phenylobacterium sp.]